MKQLTNLSKTTPSTDQACNLPTLQQSLQSTESPVDFLDQVLENSLKQIYGSILVAVLECFLMLLFFYFSHRTLLFSSLFNGFFNRFLIHFRPQFASQIQIKTLKNHCQDAFTYLISFFIDFVWVFTPNLDSRNPKFIEIPKVLMCIFDFRYFYIAMHPPPFMFQHAYIFVPKLLKNLFKNRSQDTSNCSSLFVSMFY